MPMQGVDMRYAYAWKNGIGIKMGGSTKFAQEWIANDYRVDRNRPYSATTLEGTPNFDGLNIYGDEIEIPIPLSPLDPILIRRRGFLEENLLGDDTHAKSIKLDGSFAL